MGPTCNHRVLSEPQSDDEGSGGDPGVDFYWAGDSKTTEGSARGPYGADYDPLHPDDTEPEDEDDLFDPYNYPDDFEGSAMGEIDENVWFDEGDDGEEDDIILDVNPEKAAEPDYFDREEDTEVGGEEEIIVEEEQPTDISKKVVEPDFTETEHKDKEEDTFLVEPPVTSVPSSTEMSGTDDEQVLIQSKNEAERPVSVFAQPGILAAFIGGAVVGLLCAILLVMFIVYRMRKKDEGSYPLDEPKRMPLTSSYSPNDKEIYA